ncbi:pirin family protein [Chamaesiphon sp. OTE_8_metabat_110]|uniref:pirin family protein n=1 Tax=Chamaesiphon sp. OTE_8_metabat_110 TaxID=2964696 RepID=UPI00286A254E|nr:pirin family protein [Chamaesiphon sp. OTE_8_metabat_110]
MVDTIQQLIEPHIQDLGGFQARRLLPSKTLTMVGPFIFFDHLGPAVFPPGKGVDVRPHPHINLATVTYLFEGAFLHRDSIGSVQEIRPGEVNWMTAGRGIVHSERSPDAERSQESTLHGIQIWVALPTEHEETAPAFSHYPASELPAWEIDGVSCVLIAGAAFARTSPVQTFSPLIYLDVQFTPGSQFSLPSDYSEQAIYSVTPGLKIDGEEIAQHCLILLKPGATVSIAAETAARCMVIGGEPVGERIKWWNFVSSNPERIDRAKQDWQQGRFDRVPGETELIPLPEEPQHQEQPL